MDRPWKPETFNGPLETGIRTVAILGASFPSSYDLQRLVAFDYLLVHTDQLGGPESLHPPTPTQSSALLVRRELVQSGLSLMMTRDLVCRTVSDQGIQYSAGENAITFLDCLTSTYLKLLKARAAWLVKELGASTDVEFRKTMRRFFDNWVEEFQFVELSSGAST
ncbi:MAG: threonine transporter [Aeromicrobium sp.]|nr:threonine transporter [Burkholderiales bacterium]